MNSKDSPEVIKFLALFARLKDWCDDDPASLVDAAATDDGVQELCGRVFLAANFLSMNERRARPLFAAPVDPAFVTAWRDFEERYQHVVANVWAIDIFPDLVPNDPSTAPRADLEWDGADDDARRQSGGIEGAIEFAQSNVDQDWRWTDQPDFIDGVEDGIAAWEQLKKDTGFDLRGVFRRRSLIPFVLVPRQVAARHGNAEVPSMLRNLQQAHDAFVFGATYAAIGLMRSIMEAVLRDHYEASGKDLAERIRNARRLPRGANEAALHRLRKMANAVLHLDREKDEGLTGMDEMRLEKEIVSLLFVLRALIEGAK